MLASVEHHRITMSPPMPRVTRVDLVRASAQTALLRVDVAELEDDPREVLLLVDRGEDEAPERLTPLPTPPVEDGTARVSFGLPIALRLARLTLVVDGAELPLVAPPERSRSDAVAAVALREARARLAQLERALAEQGPPAAGDSDDALRARLEQQLAEHRLLRAQLARELQTARERSKAVEDELIRAQAERDRLESELENEREGGASQREQLAGRLEQAQARVQYLERRVVEVQGQSARPQ